MMEGWAVLRLVGAARFELAILLDPNQADYQTFPRTVKNTTDPSAIRQKELSRSWCGSRGHHGDPI